MKLDISHRTVYRYDARMRHSTQYLRLTPPSSRRQRVLSWQLGLPARASSGRDPYGNCQHVLTLDYPHHEVSVLATGQVELLTICAGSVLAAHAGLLAGRRATTHHQHLDELQPHGFTELPHRQRTVNFGEFQHDLQQSLRQERMQRGLDLLARAFLKVSHEPRIQLLA